MMEDIGRAARSDITAQADFDIPEEPAYRLPKLPVAIAERNDNQLMGLLVRFTRWGDYFHGQQSLEEIKERSADDLVRRLENLYLMRHRPEKPASGELSMLKAQMDMDDEIIAARANLRIMQNRRTMMKMFCDHAERDAFVCSRELSRRIGGSDITRRADRGAP